MLAKIEKRPFVRQKQCPVCPQSCRSLGAIQRSALRDKTDIHFLAFADAAFPRKCGKLIAALRPMSPDRPLKASLRREFKQPFRCSRAKVYSRFSARIEKTH